MHVHASPKPRAFHGSVDIRATSAKARLVELAEEIIQVLAQDPDAEIRVCVEISATYSGGSSSSIRPAVTENANQLGFRSKVWE